MAAKVQPIREEAQEAHASLMTVTPAMAQEWIRKNIAHNRKVVPSLVMQYAEDIRTNHWQVNGASIVMSDSGQIIDGQHRLLAIIEANKSIETLVVSGVVDSAFETIDSGRRRTPADVLSILGYTNVVNLAALANLWMLWELKHRVSNIGNQTPFSTQMVVACATAHLDDFERAIRMTSTVAKLFKGGTIHAFYWLKFGDTDVSDRDFFFERLNDGQGLMQGDPIYALRQAFLNMLSNHRSMSRELYGGLLVKGWNKYRNRERIQILSFSAQESYPDPV